MSDDQTSPVKKSKQLLPDPQLKNSPSSSSTSSSSNFPSRHSSGSDIRNDPRIASTPGRPPSRTRSARPSLAGTESSMVSSSGFGSGFESRRHSVSHENLPMNSEPTIFPGPRISSNEIIFRLAAIEDRLQQQNEDLQKGLTQLRTELKNMNHKFSECCEVMNLLRQQSSPTNLSDVIPSGVSSPRSSRQANLASPNPSVGITQSPSPRDSPEVDSPQLDQKNAASRKTSEFALHSRTFQTTKV